MILMVITKNYSWKIPIIPIIVYDNSMKSLTSSVNVSTKCNASAEISKGIHFDDIALFMHTL